MIYTRKAEYATPTIFLLHKKTFNLQKKWRWIKMKAAFKKHSHTTLTLVEITSCH